MDRMVSIDHNPLLEDLLHSHHVYFSMEWNTHNEKKVEKMRCRNRMMKRNERKGNGRI